MSVFDKKTEKEALKAGGRLEREGGYTPEEVEMAIRLTREIAENQADGFFIVVQTSKPNENQTKAEGMMKINKTDKMRVLEVVMRSIGMDREAMQQFLLLKSISD